MQSHSKDLRTIHPFLPAGFSFINAITERGIRVIGDVHGDIQSFIHATSTDRFIIQLGDLVDYGPDSEATLYLMLRIMREGRGIFILGNHDRKLARVLSGRRPHIDSQLEKTLQQIAVGPHLLKPNELAAALNNAPAWIVVHRTVFVHGAFHPAMLRSSPYGATQRMTPIFSRALFGETTRHIQPDGYPERTLRWVDFIETGYHVYCGHDNRSLNGLPYVKTGAKGGMATFLDLGAGKGGHLAWLDLAPEAILPGRDAMTAFS